VRPTESVHWFGAVSMDSCWTIEPKTGEQSSVLGGVRNKEFESHEPNEEEEGEEECRPAPQQRPHNFLLRLVRTSVFTYTRRQFGHQFEVLVARFSLSLSLSLSFSFFSSHSLIQNRLVQLRGLFSCPRPIRDDLRFAPIELPRLNIIHHHQHLSVHFLSLSLSLSLSLYSCPAPLVLRHSHDKSKLRTELIGQVPSNPIKPHRTAKSVHCDSLDSTTSASRLSDPGGQFGREITLSDHPPTVNRHRLIQSQIVHV
jgi:hypothetical protein